MKAFNALALKPICVLPEKSSTPRKNISIPHISPLKLPNTSSRVIIPETLSRSFHGGLVLLSSFLTTKLSHALTYEEALNQSVTNNAAADEVDAGSLVDFLVENPLVIGGGIAVLVVPLILSQFLGKPKPYGVESAKNGYAKLSDDPNCQLLDIRGLKDIREVGSPDIRGLKKKPVSIVYKGEDKPGFLQKLGLKFKDPENTTLLILDKFDGNSELVAELVTANGFKSAFAIKDGAEGPRGWMNSGLPWILPKKTLSLDFSNLSEAFSGALEGGSDALPVALGLAAATGLGLVAFTEVETILQLLGSAALVQVFSKKLLFAEDRKQTLSQVDEFLTTKIAPQGLLTDIKEIGSALLPTSTSSKALLAPVASPSTEPAADDTVQKAESSPELPKVEAPPTPEINALPQTEAKPESSHTGVKNRPLSPYPSYPDLKPPTSPCPSQP